MNHSRTTVSGVQSVTSKSGAGPKKPARTRKGNSSKTGDALEEATSHNPSAKSPPASEQHSEKPQICNAQQHAVTRGEKDAADTIALWPAWPAAGVDRNGVVHTTNAKVLQTLESVLVQTAGQPLRLTDSANRRLWSLVSQNQSEEQWKVLDPVYWPFIGIVGWSEKSSNMLQLAVWEIIETPWQIDDSWREILTATAAVKAKRKRRVA